METKFKHITKTKANGEIQNRFYVIFEKDDFTNTYIVKVFDEYSEDGYGNVLVKKCFSSWLNAYKFYLKQCKSFQKQIRWNERNWK